MALGAFIAADVSVAFPDDSATAGAKTASGTVATVSAADKVLSVRGMVFSKTFVLGANCALTVADHKAASLADFRPGEKVEVRYRNIDGVLIASSIAEVRLTFAGTVSAFDPAQHTLTLQHDRTVRAFKVADNCGVILNGDVRGGLGDIKLGSRVTVFYETPDGQWTARRIEQPSLQFTGSLDTINARDRIISASKKLIGAREFHLAADCAIVMNGTIHGRMQDLRPGQEYELSYTTANGVNIVNRIAPAPGPERSGANGPGTGLN
jgi:hypothetical protein